MAQITKKLHFKINSATSMHTKFFSALAIKNYVVRIASGITERNSQFVIYTLHVEQAQRKLEIFYLKNFGYLDGNNLKIFRD